MIVDYDGKKFFSEPSKNAFWYLLLTRFTYPWTSNFLLWHMSLRGVIPSDWFFDDVFYTSMGSPFDENYYNENIQF